MFSRGRNFSIAPAFSRIFSDRADGRLVQVDPRRLADLGLGHLDRVGVLGAEEVIDTVNHRGGGIFVLDEDFLELPVAVGEQEDARRGPTVAAGAAGFLVVGFEGPRHVEVDHRANVGLVDPHAEGVGGDDDVGLALHEPLLRDGALLAADPRVVDDHRSVQLALEELPHRLASRPAGGVDDGGAGVPVEHLGHRGELVGVAAGLDHGVGQVRAVEPGDKLRRVTEVELVGDVAADQVGGGGRQRDAGGRPSCRRAWPIFA